MTGVAGSVSVAVTTTETAEHGPVSLLPYVHFVLNVPPLQTGCGSSGMTA
jgi:hypothetical protein